MAPDLAPPIAGGTAARCVWHILASRVEELRRVMRGRADAGRTKQLGQLTHWRDAVGALLAARNDPDAPALGTVPADQLGGLCALAAGDVAQRRPLRDVASGTALRLLEILESRGHT